MVSALVKAQSMRWNLHEPGCLVNVRLVAEAMGGANLKLGPREAGKKGAKWQTSESRRLESHCIFGVTVQRRKTFPMLENGILHMTDDDQIDQY